MTFNIKKGDNSKGRLASVANNVINNCSFKLVLDKFFRKYFPREMTAKRIVANLDMPIVVERVCQYRMSAILMMNPIMVLMRMLHAGTLSVM